jgi:hypothetical protein
MNDKLTELIKNVFDHLESLDETEFKKNLASYYEDPLTEVFLKANISTDNNYEYLPAQFLNTCEHEKDLGNTVTANYYSSLLSKTLAATWGDMCLRDLTQNTFSINYESSTDVFSVWITDSVNVDNISNSSELIDMIDIGYSWAEAA